MSYTIEPIKQFKKDHKRLQNQGKDIKKLEKVIELLIDGGELPTLYRDHKLSGQWKGHRECHVQSDWLLIYKVNEKTKRLFLLERGVIRIYSAYNLKKCVEFPDSNL